MNKKKTLEDIFNDDEFGILDSKAKASNVKSEDERLIDSFQEVNAFYQKNNREPKADVFIVSERSLGVVLKELRKNNRKKEILKPYDIYNLLGNTTVDISSIDDILNDDEFGLLDTDDTLEIFKLKNVPSSKEREEADFVARRKSIKGKDFDAYEVLFKNVHVELKNGKRKLVDFKEDNLQEGVFYVLDGLMMLLEQANIETLEMTLPSGKRLRKDGRTRIIFENGTESNMLYRSLAKALYINGKVVTHSSDTDGQALINNANAVTEADSETGWIYILKSKSTNEEIQKIANLYKIGFSKAEVKERIKNASKEPTYLLADVEIISTYKCYNLNPQKFESLLHRFFAEVCLNIDVFEKGQRLMPREWFVVPLDIIDQAINLILSGQVVNYKYDNGKIKVVGS